MRTSWRQVLTTAVLALLLLPWQALARDAFVPILYRVSDKDNSLYVLGSIHQLSEADAKLPKWMTDLFDKSVVSVFELPAKDLLANREEMVGQFLRYAYFDDGQRIQPLLKPRELEILRERMKAFGLPESNWQSMRPWLIGLLLEIETLSQKGMQSEHGIDLQLIKRGESMGKRQDALETVEDQIRALASSPMQEQIADLMEQLSPTGAGDADLDAERMILAWKMGDVAAMGTFEEQFRKQYPRTHHAVMTERNQRWIPKLRQYLDGRKSGNVMVVVGALHLIGDQGIIRLLQAQGYRVERVRAPGSVPASRRRR